MPDLAKRTDKPTKKATKGKVSNMRSEVAFISVSDLHLSSEVPRARGEKDWFPVMERYLEQLARLKKTYRCEVVYAGDIFDDWRVSAELINFTLKHLPSGYAV